MLGGACSSDDNGVAETLEEAQEAKTLKLTSNKLEVEIGDEIKFNVTVGENDISDAIITEGEDVVVRHGTWKATRAGTFKFKATKSGYEVSNEVIVEVYENVKELLNYIQVGDISYGIDEAWLMVETEFYDGENHPKFYYFEEKGEVVYFCKFLMDMRSSDYESENGNVRKGAVARVFKGVIQDVTSKNLILPGAGGTEVDLDGWILSQNGSVDFDDILKFDVDMKELNKGGKTSILLEDGKSKIVYNGEFKSIRAVPQ